MPFLSKSTLVLSALSFLLTSSTCSALSKQQRIACQSPTNNPLQGCPAKTLLVDAASGNSSSNSSTFSTIQSAVLSLPQDNSTQYILILPGIYTEQVNITRPGPLYFFGQTPTPNDLSQNSVELLWHQATGTTSTGTLDNAYTSTLTIAPTLNSSLTGSGPTGNPVPDDTPFGSHDFRAYNLNITNDYLPYSAGPSLALSTSYANTAFYHCALASYQDTVYVGKHANSYMHSSTISGQTDFLYGFGTLWIEASTLLLRSCGGGITAWKGTNTTYSNQFGVYVVDSQVQKANASLALDGKCALGRPWNALHRSIFAHTFLDESILPAGYVEWSATEPRVNNQTFMAEYENSGPGWDVEGRLEGGVTRVLTASEWKPYSSVERVFAFFKSGRVGNVGWVDFEA